MLILQNRSSINIGTLTLYNLLFTLVPINTPIDKHHTIIIHIEAYGIFNTVNITLIASNPIAV